MHRAHLLSPSSKLPPTLSSNLSLGLILSGLILSSFLLQSLASSPAQALDILSFDLAIAPSSTAPPETHPRSLPTSAATANPSVILKPISLKPISFNSDQASIQTNQSIVAPPGNALAMRQANSQAPRDQWLFEGGANSLVAVAVGNAEGTRTAWGDRTWAYDGHVDPGNGAWNQGSFSYQHRASSPEEADQKQLARLSTQAADLRQQAQNQGMPLTLLEELSGIDLANQAPLAALDQGGYIDWLWEAKQRQLTANEAIVWARTWSYWDPHLDRWNAPGLGNNWEDIYADQERRHWAVVQATIRFGLAELQD